jgi:hypothetical protein
LSGAVFVPHNSATAIGGVDATVTPAALRGAITPMLRRWGVLIDGRRSSKGGRL